jgi:hypothetical protein
MGWDSSYHSEWLKVADAVIEACNGMVSVNILRKPTGRGGDAGSLRAQVIRHGVARYTLDADFLLPCLGKIVGHLQTQPHFRAGTERLG